MFKGVIQHFTMDGHQCLIGEGGVRSQLLEVAAAFVQALQTLQCLAWFLHCCMVLHVVPFVILEENRLLAGTIEKK